MTVLRNAILTALGVLLMLPSLYSQDKKQSRPPATEVKPRVIEPAIKTKVDPQIMQRMELAMLTDFDGMQYRTLKVGDAVWMVDNLASDHNANGWELPTSWSTWAGTYYYYGGNGNDRKFHWKIILQDNPAGQIGLSPGKHGSDANPSGVQGICPNGWHIPSEAEWMDLIDQMGGMDHAADKMRTLLHMDDDIYWSCTEKEGGNIPVIKLVEGKSKVYIMNGSNNSMHHLRCAQDAVQ